MILASIAVAVFKNWWVIFPAKWKSVLVDRGAKSVDIHLYNWTVCEGTNEEKNGKTLKNQISDSVSCKGN